MAYCLSDFPYVLVAGMSMESIGKLKESEVIRMKPYEKQIHTALKALGVKGKFSARKIAGDMSRLAVTVNGKSFGVFDTIRNTFVD